MAITTYLDFLNAYVLAMAANEDVTIEVAGEFEIEALLPALKTHYKVKVVSYSGSCTLFSPLYADHDFNHFTITTGGLILENIKLDKHPLEVNHSYGGVEVGNNGSLELINCQLIQLKSKTAGGVWVKRNGRFIMRNSSILTCLGDIAGAIWVEEDATFNMEEGSIICDCLALNDAYGAQLVIYGDMLLSSGLITNSQPSTFNGIKLGEEATFTMKEGQITKCLIGLQVESGSTAIIEEGIFAFNQVGIATQKLGSRKKIEINGGIFHDNRVGIELNDGFELTMTSGQIYNHHDPQGAGIVGIYGKNGKFTMTGGEIFNNVQGIAWQQNQLNCDIKGDVKIYNNGFGLLLDHATVSVSGGKI